MKPYSNLIELLLTRAKQAPKRTAFTFLVDDSEEVVEWSYAELDLRARAIAAVLQFEGAAKRRVLLVYPPGLEFISALWGCLYAGAVAVPAHPPRANRSLSRFTSIVKDAKAEIALGTEQVVSRMEALAQTEGQHEKLRWISTDHLDHQSAALWKRPQVAGESIALIQYTSGSTSTPKGVLVSHSNLLQNEAQIQKTFQQSERATIVGWLPLYHDMGLMGNVLQPLYLGARCILMSPVAFSQEPFNWLKAISNYRATTSGGPNFAYDLCTRNIRDDQVAQLDLSSWKVAYNGAEPVRAATLNGFAAKFAKAGFDPAAFCPCYGLAEATLLVTGCPAGKHYTVLGCDETALLRNEVRTETNDTPVKWLVSSGSSNLAKIRIVDPEFRSACASGRIGEIWVSGPSISRGYWNRREETQHTFRGSLVADEGSRFLRTGDLGFIHDGQLFVTGRIKDLIIIRGRNHYPHDIELSVESADERLRPGSGAAFSIDVNGEEQLILLYELDRTYQKNAEEIVDGIRRTLAEVHEIRAHTIALLKRGSIPKTSSGKIQRHLCRDLFLEGGYTSLLVQDGSIAKSLSTACLSDVDPSDRVLQW
ncbi:MAG TPA: fatty acyl-AMP ligase, partial [Edaphobacter sp.]|nr:fatty acyl-AMP ligase [Edaphobacter sp.]